MKKILFYILLLFQIIVILLIVLQYDLIDKYGVERTFITESIEEEYYVDDIQAYDTYTFEFEINTIPKDKWEGENLDYSVPVYVLLKENKSGIYEVVKASDKKLTADKINETVLIGKDIYQSENGFYYVDYGFETISVKNHQSLFKDYDVSQPAQVTYKNVPWQQSKLISIE